MIIHAGAEGAGALHTPYGSEYYLGEDRGNARAFAHAVVNAGASLVLGSGPHVIRGIERYRGRLIAYSLGDFVGYHTLGGGGVLARERDPARHPRRRRTRARAGAGSRSTSTTGCRARIRATPARS